MPGYKNTGGGVGKTQYTCTQSGSTASWVRQQGRAAHVCARAHCAVSQLMDPQNAIPHGSIRCDQATATGTGADYVKFNQTCKLNCDSGYTQTARPAPSPSHDFVAG